MSIKIELSIGELLDKISILQIKAERINDPSKLENMGGNFRPKLPKKSSVVRQ